MFTEQPSADLDSFMLCGDSDGNDTGGSAWGRLRAVIADEFIEKLPDHLTVEELAALLRRSIDGVRADIECGRIVGRSVGDTLVILPRENSRYFQQEMLLHLPPPPSLLAIAIE